MFYRFYKLADRICKSSILKSILRTCFPYFYKQFLNYREDKVKENYRKYGLDALKLFCETLDKNGYEYTLAFGTMLGAIREKGFIKHDHDIDIFIWFEKYDDGMIRCLERAGFIWTNTRQVCEGKLGREDQFTYKGLSIDLFFLYENIKKYPYCCIFILDEDKRYYPRRIELPVSRNRRLQDFEDTKLYIPENAEEICKFRYGPNYMIPDPDYDWESDKSCVEEWKEYKDNTINIQNPTL